MKAIVTGHKGFIGKAVYDFLLQKKWIVYGYDKLDNQDLLNNQISFPKVDVIFHLAATNGTKLFYNSPAEVLKNNTLLNFCFDAYMRKYPNTKFIFASTCEIFNGAVDNFGWEVPTDESVPAVFFDIHNPRWSYSLPKALGENYFMNNYENVSIIRYFNIFGEGQKDHFISEFIKRCLLEKKFIIYGNDTRSFCYVKDAAKMSYNMIESDSGVFNIGRSCEYKISEIAYIIMKILGFEDKVLEIKSSPKGSVKRRCPSMMKYNEHFGCFEYTPLEFSLLKTVNWYVDNIGKVE